MPSIFFQKVVILHFERQYPKENTVALLKSNILAPQIFAPKKILGWMLH